MIPFDEITDAILVTLTPREEQVLRLYYGLRCEKKRPKDIAKEFQVTPGRIHQIVQKALRKVAARFTGIHLVEFPTRKDSST
jgi:RNA polymerase sigma factor (sigma-70 family)